MPDLTARPDHRGAFRHDPSAWRSGISVVNRQVFATMGDWIARSYARRRLRDLIERGDEHLLRDIGVTRAEAIARAAKWFWQR
jgi:uncharacterized protein YjiS (DUF1127 family)